MTSNRLKHVALATLSFLILLVLWSAVTYSGLIQPFFLPTPLGVLRSLFSMFSDQNFAIDVAVSLVRILVGFWVAVVFAIPIGILVGLNKRAETLIEPPIDFIRYTPIPAFIPLFILWFGIGELEKVVVIAASVFFQLVLMVANSVSHTPREIIEAAETLGASRWQVLTRVVYPFAKPRILDDLRVSMGWAWAGLVLAEIVGSTSGIGFVIIQSQRLLQTAQVIAAIVVVGVLGLVSDYLFKVVHRSLFPWVPRIHRHGQA